MSTTVAPASTTADSSAPALERLPAREWEVIRPLTRLEVKRLFRSSVPVGVVLLLLQLGGSSNLSDLKADSISSAFASLPLAAMTLVASHRAVCRARRDGAEELFEPTPAPPRARTIAHLLAVAAPALIALAAALVSITRQAVGPHVGQVDLAELAVGPLLVAGAGCLGVLLARMWPRQFVPFAACFVIAVFEMQTVGERFVGTPIRELAFWREGTLVWALPDRRAWAHAAFLVGLITCAVCGALLRQVWTRPVVIASVLALCTVGASFAVKASSAGPAHWDRVEQLLVDPDAVRDCSARGGVTYCSLPFSEGLIDAAVRPLVDDVMAAVPAARRPSNIVVAQRISPSDLQYSGASKGNIGKLVPAIRAAADQQSPDDGRVYVATEWGWAMMEELGIGVAVGSLVVGLPTGVGDDGAVCSAAGQARSAVALWLAGNASNVAAKKVRELAASTKAAAGGAPGHFTISEVDVHGGAAFGVEDALLAVELLGRPAAEVRSAMATNWERLTDPSATTASAAELLGVSNIASPRSNGATTRPDVGTERLVEIEGVCA